VARLHNDSKRIKGGNSDPRTKVDLENLFCLKKHDIWLQNYIFIKNIAKNII